MYIGDDIELILSIERIFKIYMLKTIVENLKRYKKNIFQKKNKIIIQIYSYKSETPEISEISEIDYNNINYITLIKKSDYVINQYQLFSKDTDRVFIEKSCKIIKSNYKYHDLNSSDIYFVIIFIFYALRYNEPSTDILDMDFLKHNLIDYNKSIELFFVIVNGRLIVKNKDVSSLLRTYILGIKKTEETEETENVCSIFTDCIFNIFCMNFDD